jgi:hypothetical protein
MKSEYRAHEELQALIGRALVEPGFQHELLNGGREECLAEFPLTADEYAVARAIHATDLGAYARQLDEWIRKQALRPVVTPFVPAVSARLAAAA